MKEVMLRSHYNTRFKRLMFRCGVRKADWDRWVDRAQFNRMMGDATLWDRFALWLFEEKWQRENAPRLPDADIPPKVPSPDIVRWRQRNAEGNPMARPEGG